MGVIRQRQAECQSNAGSWDSLVSGPVQALLTGPVCRWAYKPAPVWVLALTGAMLKMKNPASAGLSSLLCKRTSPGRSRSLLRRLGVSLRAVDFPQWVLEEPSVAAGKCLSGSLLGRGSPFRLAAPVLVHRA